MSSRKRARERSGSNELVPFRETSDLFVHPTTLRCAELDHCVSCAYKVGCWDVALDSELCRSVPNVRPELCPRSKADDNKEGGHLLGYEQLGLRVLTVGDGDLSFSLAVARRVRCDPPALASCVCATSYESLETLRRVYDNIDETLNELHQLRVKVAFQVDATRLGETLFSQLDELRVGPPCFDRIVWNFPCAAVAKGQDGQNQEIEHNKSMVRRFVSQSRHYLAPGGEIHMNHKTKVRRRHKRLAPVNVGRTCTNAPHAHRRFDQTAPVQSMENRGGGGGRLPGECSDREVLWTSRFGPVPTGTVHSPKSSLSEELPDA